MKIYHTESGSRYEVDVENSRARKVVGDPTRRATPAWRKIEGHIVVNGRLLLNWDSDTPLLDGSPDYARPATITSLVVKVEEA